jgi:hypothetical protein
MDHVHYSSSFFDCVFKLYKGETSSFTLLDLGGLGLVEIDKMGAARDLPFLFEVNYVFDFVC